MLFSVGQNRKASSLPAALLGFTCMISPLKQDRAGIRCAPLTHRSA